MPIYMCMQGGIRCNNYYSVFCIEKTPYCMLNIPYYFAVHLHVLASYPAGIILHNCSQLYSFGLLSASCSRCITPYLPRKLFTLSSNTIQIIDPWIQNSVFSYSAVTTECLNLFTRRNLQTGSQKLVIISKYNFVFHYLSNSGCTSIFFYAIHIVIYAR